MIDDFQNDDESSEDEVAEIQTVNSFSIKIPKHIVLIKLKFKN